MYQVIDSFSDFHHGNFNKGQVLADIPEGVDWERAGLVIAIGGGSAEIPMPIDPANVAAFLSGTVKDVAERVVKCNDVATLTAAREEATRKGVQSAIDLKIQELEADE